MSRLPKHCLIVGMGAGLSLAVAKRFAAEGFAISAIARNRDSLSGFQTSLPPTARYNAVAADVAHEASLRRAVFDCEQANGSVSVLVYNVANMLIKPLLELSPQELRQSLQANVEGALVAAQAVLPSMISKRNGTLLFTGGGLALYPSPNVGGLAIGKAAIRSLALTLAKEVDQFDVHAATVTICGMIQPGTYFAPDKIAEVYWQLHADLPGEFRDEVIYRDRNAQ